MGWDGSQVYLSEGQHPHSYDSCDRLKQAVPLCPPTGLLKIEGIRVQLPETTGYWPNLEFPSKAAANRGTKGVRDACYIMGSQKTYLARYLTFGQLSCRCDPPPTGVRLKLRDPHPALQLANSTGYPLTTAWGYAAPSRCKWRYLWRKEGLSNGQPKDLQYLITTSFSVPTTVNPKTSI